ncbi:MULTISPECIES: V-type ATP synthase subunit I [Tepidanaerobacter]|uniref:V/A-type H+-transporting ATPase subunit I n=1 Tax=Tepidanaerobacter syntrophicus TaxID=224999 RepID=A0A0U9HBF3_9FIRM|nr:MULTISPECIES: V-type ATP synthase subunit I [Tepidanaerobacter]GAQ24064.1 V/A-type H+-transporting ATPase subunit I [Tepidanaerobacter syntrophicus]GLI19514.1 V-type ATP synthase subunit I [Tepidanaerobacter syntrophicus]HHV84047.1 V-type ATP synthase subunit I [Tepidanaerobacter syntrophicus]
MAIVKMEKMHLLALKSEQSKLMQTLQKTGIVEVIDITEDGNEEKQGHKEDRIRDEIAKELAELEAKLSDLKFGIDFLKPYSKSPNPLIYGKPDVKKDELSEILSAESKIKKSLQVVFDLDKKIVHLKSEESKILNQIDFLMPWQGLDIPLEQLGYTDKAAFMAGVIPRKSKDKLEEKIEENSLLADIKVIGERRDDLYVLIIYHISGKEEIQNLFKEFSVTIQDFMGLQGAPSEIIEQSKKRLDEIQKEREAIKTQAQGMTQELFNFEVLYDYYMIEKDRKTNTLKLFDTDKSFYLQAWIPKERKTYITEIISKITDMVYVEFTEPEENDDIPVLLSNSKLVEPFEVITELYSLPDPRGIDPNPYMAPFYWIFFGMMLSDAGYGIILSLLTAVALLKFKLEGSGKKFIKMFFLCGISTTIWGAIFGGWFGDLIKIKPLWINPLDNPMAVLIVSFALGVIQIYTGIILEGYKNIRDGHVLDAIMDQGFWLLLLTGILMFVFQPLAGIAKYLAIIGVVGLVLTQGRAQKNVLMKFASGVLSLYNITGYLSDLLSYSRLLALGLTTGVIASVINTMAKTISGSIIGFIIMILVLLGGHVFNIVINALGAYVHSSRLQYIEFFSKFYESGGRAFDPLRIKTTYVKLEDL